MSFRAWAAGSSGRPSARGRGLGRVAARRFLAVLLVALLVIATAFVSPATQVIGWPPQTNAYVSLPRSVVLDAPHSVRGAYRRLSQRPIDAGAISTLADASRQEHGVAGAIPLYELAVHRAPRDAVMRGRLFGLLLSLGDYQRALIQLDAWLRLDPPAAKTSLESWLATSDQGMLSDFAARLADDPPWRSLAWDILGHPNAAGNLRITLEAVAARRPLRLDEVLLLAPLLERDGEAARARRIWARALPNERQGSVKAVYDGGFEQPDGPAPYGWITVGHPVGYFAGREQSHSRRGREFALQFPGGEVTFAPIQQALTLGPGQYRLSALVHADVEGDTDDFVLLLTCRAPVGTEAQDPGRRLSSLPIPRQTHGWQRIAVDFSIDVDCPLQLLQFAHLPVSRAPRGTLAIDEINVDRGQVH
jgi:tetratricopeptide (TPR) repeat protein